MLPNSPHAQDLPLSPSVRGRGKGEKAAAALLLLALGSLATPQSAQARPDVQWSVTIGTPVYAAPVYVPPPRPVYVQPAPVVYGPPVYGYYYEERGPRWSPPAYHHHHHHHGGGRYRDSDRDGVPDRWERRPDNPWRR